jgi:hypothetical protein
MVPRIIIQRITTCGCHFTSIFVISRKISLVSKSNMELYKRKSWEKGILRILALQTKHKGTIPAHQAKSVEKSQAERKRSKNTKKQKINKI